MNEWTDPRYAEVVEHFRGLPVPTASEPADPELPIAPLVGGTPARGFVLYRPDPA